MSGHEPLRALAEQWRKAAAKCFNPYARSAALECAADLEAALAALPSPQLQDDQQVVQSIVLAVLRHTDAELDDNGEQVVGCNTLAAREEVARLLASRSPEPEQTPLECDVCGHNYADRQKLRASQAEPEQTDPAKMREHGTGEQ